MTSDELRGLMAAMDMTKAQLAELLQVNPRTAARWVAGEQDIPGAAAVALRALVEHGESYESARRFMNDDGET